METKKNKKADLDARRGTGFMLGLIIALSLFFVALEYNSRPAEIDEDDSMLDEISEDLTMSPALDNRDMVSAVQGQASKAITNNVKETGTSNHAMKLAPVTSKLVIGDGLGATKAATITEALPQIPTESPDTAVLKTVEQMPEFPGGIVQFMKWLTKNLRYPYLAQQKKIKGKVIISFIINKDGSIAMPKIVKSADPLLDREAMRVVRMMPRWKPGLDKGKPCRTMFAIPINFEL